MGHINLAAPIVHIWFFKALPSRLGAMLDMKTSDIEKIVYFQDYVVTDPGKTPLKKKQLLTEDEYRAAYEKYGADFEAEMGAEAIKKLLGLLDLNTEQDSIRRDIEKTNSKQKIKDLTKRLKMIEAIRGSENKAEWMVMDVIPGDPARPAPAGPAGERQLRHVGPQRPVPPHHQPQQPPQEAGRPQRARGHHPQREADAQQAVDALFDNGRCRRPVLGSSNRPLKSLTDMIKGKQGRFRENLLGKRVDYSARSVIVVGPELKLHQCGLPKKIALELYQPFIIRKLKEHGLADTIKSAKKMLERRDPEVWDILEEVIYQHPVMLNRAPTLHRMGIQAFEPVLVEGNAIKIHPLVCKGFNADFDGDQMAVHLPLSIEAQTETHVLMLAPNNIFSPANGSPDHHAVAGHRARHVLHHQRPRGRPRRVQHLQRHQGGPDGLRAGEDRDALAHLRPALRPHRGRARGQVRPGADRRPVVEAPGGAPQAPEGRLRHQAAPREVLGQGGAHDGGALHLQRHPAEGDAVLQLRPDRQGLQPRHRRHLRDPRPPGDDQAAGRHEGAGLQAQHARALSFGITDIRSPDTKPTILDEGQKKADKIEKNYRMGAITEQERYAQLIDVWGHARKQVTEDLMAGLSKDYRDDEGKPVPVNHPGTLRYLNPIAMMAISGARGNVDQIRQLGGMRGLMAKPVGRDHRDAHQVQLPRGPVGAGVLQLHPRRPQGVGRHGAQDRRLRLPHPQARRRGAERDHQRDRLRHAQRRDQDDDLQGRDGRGRAEGHDRRAHRPRHDPQPDHRRDDRRGEQVITNEIADALKELKLESIRVRSRSPARARAASAPSATAST
jgi:DNA-directed RNA polymerase subunit beta'